MPCLRRDLLQHLDVLLEPSRYHDYGPNGLQVEGRDELRCLASSCTASLQACRAASDAGADALLVHHGLFWGKAPSTVTGMLKPRLASLLAADCNLFAYHLPLDGHPSLGNNAVGLRRLQIPIIGGFADAGAPIGLWGEVPPRPIESLIAACVETFAHPVIHCPGGPSLVGRIGMLSGGGQNYLQEAAEQGLDVLITGETSEQSWHEAAERGIHLLACGHHATENLAVHELAAQVAAQYDLTHLRLDGDNPL